jgi:hypothetical protein
MPLLLVKRVKIEQDEKYGNLKVFCTAKLWRRERDSNPRGGLLPPIDLANRPLQPLGYLSVTEVIITQEALLIKVNRARDLLELYSAACVRYNNTYG